VKYRIAAWGVAGVFIALCWALYFAQASKDLPIDPIVSVLARLSCPIALVGDYFHFGVKLSWVLVANAAFYTLFGLIVETLRRQLNHAK
jgi:hypothetical protein